MKKLTYRERAIELVVLLFLLINLLAIFKLGIFYAILLFLFEILLIAICLSLYINGYIS